MKRKASDLGTEEQPQAQKNQPKKKTTGTNEALFIDKDELMRSMHFAAIKTADDVCDEVKRNAGLERFDIDPQVVSAVTSLLWTTMSDAWSPDLNTFAGHAHRTSINVDDVRLLMRRNEDLGKKIEDECGITPTSSGTATTTTRKNSGRRSRGAQNAVLPTATPSASTMEQHEDATGFPLIDRGLTPRPPVAQSTPLRATPAMGRKLPPGRLPSPIQEVNEAYMDVAPLPLSPSFAHALMNNTEASTSFSRPRRERWAMEEGENDNEAVQLREEQALEWEREQALKSLAESKGGGVASETEDPLWDDQPPPEEQGGEPEEVPETPPLGRVEEGAEHDSFDDDAEFVTMGPKRKVAKNGTQIGEKTLLRDLGISDETRSCAREHERILSSTGNRSKVKPQPDVRRRNDSFFDEEEDCEVVTIVDQPAPAASSLGSTLPPPTQERDKGASNEDSFDEELELVDVVKPGNANEPQAKKPSCIVNPFRKITSTSVGAPPTPSSSGSRVSGRSAHGVQNYHNIHRVGVGASEVHIDRAPTLASTSVSNANHLQQNTAQRSGQAAAAIGHVSQSNFRDSLEDDFVTPRRPPSANARPTSAASVLRKTTPASNERANNTNSADRPPVQGRPGRLSNDSFFDDDLSRMFDLRSQSSQESVGVNETPQRRPINALARKSTSSTRNDSEPSRAGHIGHRAVATPTVSTRPLQINPPSISGAQLPLQTSAPRPTNVDKNPPPRSKFGGKFSAFSFENDPCPTVIKENKSSSAFSFSDATEANKTGDKRVSIRQESRETANDSFEDDDF